MEKKHTPGPWEAVGNPPDIFGTDEHQDELICIVNANRHMADNAKANATFIVEACNNYDRVTAELATAHRSEVSRGLEILRLRDQRNDLADALGAVTNELAEWLKQDGGCDHSVGICYCSTIRMLEQAQAALKRAGR